MVNELVGNSWPIVVSSDTPDICSEHVEYYPPQRSRIILRLTRPLARIPARHGKYAIRSVTGNESREGEIYDLDGKGGIGLRQKGST